MTSAIIGILITLILILIVMVMFLFRKPLPESDAITEVAKIMRSEHDEKMRLRQEQEMIDYARSKLPDVIDEIRSSTEQGERQVRINRKNAELIPFGLNETEKRIWEEFNRD